MSAFLALLPMAFKLIEFFIDKSSENKELREKYVDFLESMHGNTSNPVKAYKSIERQKAKLRAMNFDDQTR